jgi:hypothetical protein
MRTHFFWNVEVNVTALENNSCKIFAMEVVTMAGHSVHSMQKREETVCPSDFIF